MVSDSALMSRLHVNMSLDLQNREAVIMPESQQANHTIENDHQQERALAFSYLPTSAQDAVRILFSLDDLLGVVARTTRDAMVAQMRLTWWYHALAALDDAPPPAEPVLRGLSAQVLPRGVTGATLARLVTGWETLLEDEPQLALIAEERGAVLFAAAATVIGVAVPTAMAGEGWALADAAVHSRDAGLAARARIAARDRLAQVVDKRWPEKARALGALALLARFDVADVPPPVAGPRRVARLAWHRLTGR